MKRFLIKLSKLHNDSGVSVYGVHKATGLAYNTVNKYVHGDVVSENLPHQALVLIAFYGGDWRDPSVVEIIEVDDEEEIKTPLAASA